MGVGPSVPNVLYKQSPTTQAPAYITHGKDADANANAEAAHVANRQRHHQRERSVLKQAFGVERTLLTSEAWNNRIFPPKGKRMDIDEWRNRHVDWHMPITVYEFFVLLNGNNTMYGDHRDTVENSPMWSGLSRHTMRHRDYYSGQLTARTAHFNKHIAPSRRTLSP